MVPPSLGRLPDDEPNRVGVSKQHAEEEEEEEEALVVRLPRKPAVELELPPWSRSSSV
jgi:hypothetical protein